MFLRRLNWIHKDSYLKKIQEVFFISTKIKPYFYLIVVFFLWGSLFVVSKIVMAELSAFSVLTIRFVVSSVCLSLVAKICHLPKLRKQDIWKIAIIGVFGYFFSMTAQLLGTYYSSSSLASLINSMNPVTIMIFASIFLKEKITIKKVVGIGATILGSFIIIGNTADGTSIVGIILSFLAVLSWSLISILIKSVAKNNHPIRMTATGMLVAAAFSLPFSSAELFSATIQWTPSLIAALAYISILCTALAYSLWNKSLTMLDASTCSSFYPLQPLISALLSVLLLNETLSPSLIIGGCFIATGVFIVNIKIKRRLHSYGATK